MEAFDGLEEKFRLYSDSAHDLALIRRAYKVACTAHAEQTRHSGEPYVNHPIRVASILADYWMDAETLAGALLHDTLEDSMITFREIEREFGSTIARLVDGVTKVKLRQLGDVAEGEIDAESLHNMMLAMAKDVRVLVIKLADRLHNMRSIKALEVSKQRRIARETLQVYTPLAQRAGLFEMHEELEDLAFEVLNPRARKTILKRFAAVRQRAGSDINSLAQRFQEVLARKGIVCEVIGRYKRPYSIWRKLQGETENFEQLSDVAGFRVLVDPVEDCYRVLGVLHTEWPFVAGRLKDYISVPKPNGYQSLHTTVVDPDGSRLEFQIRTHEMNRLAESGITSHWRYKAGAQPPQAKDSPLAKLRSWINSMREGGSPDETLAHLVSHSINKDDIYCFTPNGRIIHLPKDATPIDFAYALHTDIGDECAGAKVNGRWAALSMKLRSGQEVEIVRSRDALPDESWPAVSPRARHYIRRAVAARKHLGRVVEGENRANAAIRWTGRDPNPALYRIAADRLGCRSVEELFGRIASEELTTRQMLAAMYPSGSDDLSASIPIIRNLGEVITAEEGQLEKKTLRLARCCSPLPEEAIVGVPCLDYSVEVHDQGCSSLADHEDARADWIDLSWCASSREVPQNQAWIEIEILNKARSMAIACDLIGTLDSNIEDLNMLERRPDFYLIRFEIAVRDAHHLKRILDTIQENELFPRAYRVRDIRSRDRQP